MITFLRTLFFFVVFCFHQLLILPLLGYFMLRSKRSGDPDIRSTISCISTSWGKLICWAGGARLSVEDHANLEEDEAVLFVSNHQGDFDIPVILAYGGRDLAFIAKKELSRIPLVSQWMDLMGCIFLDRENRRKQVSQLRTAIEQMKGGLSMVIFPEGTRSLGPEMAPFAKGSLHLAEKAGVRIVPLTLKDTYTLKPQDCPGLPGGKAKIILHPPLDPSGLSKDEKNNLHHRVQDIIQSGLDEA